MGRKRKIAVVGAGITGLTAAWQLSKNGHQVVVYERRERPGGSIRTEVQEGWLVEYGPNTLQLKEKEVLRFLEKVGIVGEMLNADSSSGKRYIVHNGELTPLPASLGEWWRTPLFSKKGKFRMLAEPLIRRGSDPEETLAGFVERRLGREVLDYAVNPFVAGIYAGDPARLSVRHAFPSLYQLEQRYGSLLAGGISKQFQRGRTERMQRSLISFRDGMQSLPDRLATGVDELKTGHTVQRVQRSDAGWQIISDGFSSGPYDAVLLNIPLYHYSEQLLNGGGALLEIVRKATYPPLSVVVTGYRRSQVEHSLDGFGFLVPEVENRNILGGLFNSSLFPGRAPDDHLLITTFVGGSRQPDLASLESGEIKKLVVGELANLLGISGETSFFDHIYWPHAIPNYNTGYDRILETVAEVESMNDGVHLAGNFRGGISLPDCIKSGIRWAKELER